MYAFNIQRSAWSVWWWVPLKRKSSAALRLKSLSKGGKETVMEWQWEDDSERVQIDTRDGWKTRHWCDVDTQISTDARKHHNIHHNITNTPLALSLSLSHTHPLLAFKACFNSIYTILTKQPTTFGLVQKCHVFILCSILIWLCSYLSYNLLPLRQLSYANEPVWMVTVLSKCAWAVTHFFFITFSLL